MRLEQRSRIKTFNQLSQIFLVYRNVGQNPPIPEPFSCSIINHIFCFRVAAWTDGRQILSLLRFIRNITSCAVYILMPVERGLHDRLSISICNCVAPIDAQPHGMRAMQPDCVEAPDRCFSQDCMHARHLHIFYFGTDECVLPPSGGFRPSGPRNSSPFALEIAWSAGQNYRYSFMDRTSSEN